MKTIKLLGIIGAAFLACSCSSSNVAVKSTGEVITATNNQEKLAKELHKEVNRYRVSVGKKPLKWHSGLAKLAKPHSNYMKQNAGTFNLTGKKNLISHYGFEARSTMAKKNYRMNSISENVIASHDMGQGVDLAAKMVRGWLTSSNHKHNMDSSWARTGISVSFDGQGRVFVTQLFGTEPSQVLTVGGPTQAW